VRVTRAGTTRRLEKPSADLAVGDILLLVRGGALAALEVKALGHRRGPPAEARTLYAEIAAAPNSDLAGLS
jgi:ribosomal 50S subunit-recycling heat shock protein